MVPLVDGGYAKELGRRAGRRGGPFSCPKHGGQVVRGILRRTLTDVKALGGALLLKEAASQLEVRVVDVACGIVEGYETVANVLGKDHSPKDGAPSCEAVAPGGARRRQGDHSTAAWDSRVIRKPNATGPKTGSVMGAHQSRSRWH
jgi:hypothetical protein